MIRDYRQWRALGPGGLPANPLGWAITTSLRPLTRETRSTHVYRLPEGSGATPFPFRAGSRPTPGRHPVPHRQLDQLPEPGEIARTARLITAAAASSPRLCLQRSHFERRGDALFVADLATAPHWLQASGGEIGHVHPSDGSLHVVLDAPDAVAAIESGWGERHPLAGVPGLGLPLGYLLIYAPRDAPERLVVETILRRACGGLTGP